MYSPESTMRFVAGGKAPVAAPAFDRVAIKTRIKIKIEIRFFIHRLGTLRMGEIKAQLARRLCRETVRVYEADQIRRVQFR